MNRFKIFEIIYIKKEYVWLDYRIKRGSIVCNFFLCYVIDEGDR